MTEFVLQDSRGNTGDRLMFWGKNGSGYTTNLDAAQRYTKEEASSQNECRETDLPWPLAYLLEHHTLAVDCQYVKPDEIATQLDGTEPVYLYAARAWNGNDLLWQTADGRHSDNLAEAEAFEGSMGVSIGAVGRNGLRAIPKAIADGLARKVVASAKVNHKKALRGTGIMLAKRQKPSRSSIQNCGGCGRFVPSPVYTDCSHCGGSNAP
ncbi:hypothetical protein [Pseudomonas sp. UMAB-40]|uniref:hypothetical protein n=1 Tax=Pseudomonas sp. UMAB-40 TaxID=1365407 RepID=UPI001C582C10|nr:hypothetical protein [Pseudomonas sp. UMAB-40]